jgi:tripartite-type tricarboxylate transporter receptor subunit TctC
VRAAVADPTFRQQMITQGTEPIGGSPADFQDYWTREINKWGEVIKSRGIRAPS